jgi:archaellum component FlaG (FlaF/FlaG flagellin family)
MIMLITALLISGGASALLLSEWSDAVRVVQINERASNDKDDVSVALAGDPAMVAHNTTANTITLYFLNTGSYDLDTSDYEVLIDGAAPTSSTETVLPSGTAWNPGDLLEVVLTDSGWSYSDGEDISVYFVGVSERINGYTHSATASAEVRLNAFS